MPSAAPTAISPAPRWCVSARRPRGERDDRNRILCASPCVAQGERKLQLRTYHCGVQCLNARRQDADHQLRGFYRRNLPDGPDNLLRRLPCRLIGNSRHHGTLMAPTIHTKQGFRFFFFSRESRECLFALSARKVRLGSGWKRKELWRGRA